MIYIKKADGFVCPNCKEVAFIANRDLYQDEVLDSGMISSPRRALIAGDRLECWSCEVGISMSAFNNKIYWREIK